MSTQKILLGIAMYVAGLVTFLSAPLSATAYGLAEGERCNGPYQKMSPEEKQVFWKSVRAAVKAAAGWYANDQRRKGNRGAADAATRFRKIL